MINNNDLYNKHSLLISLNQESDEEIKPKHAIQVCMGTSCVAKGANSLLELCQEYAQQYPLLFCVTGPGCLGPCIYAPVVIIDNTVHSKQTVESLEEILQNLVNNG